LHHNFGRHLGVDGARIAVSSRFCECVGEVLICTQRLGPKALFLADDVVGDIIFIDPVHSAATGTVMDVGEKAKLLILTSEAVFSSALLAPAVFGRITTIRTMSTSADTLNTLTVRFISAIAPFCSLLRLPKAYGFSAPFCSKLYRRP